MINFLLALCTLRTEEYLVVEKGLSEFELASVLSGRQCLSVNFPACGESCSVPQAGIIVRACAHVARLDSPPRPFVFSAHILMICDP